MMRAATKILVLIVLINYYCSTTQAHFDFSRLTDSKPKDATESFDCSVRQLAYDYAMRLQGWRGKLQSVFDALELQTKCNITSPRTSDPDVDTYVPPKFPLPKAGTSFYVDAVNGNDNNAGTLSQPFQTIARAVSASRSSAVQRPVAILLRKGTFYLKDTISLSAQDSGLTISNYNGESVYVSGGIPLNITNWQPYNVSSTPKLTIYNNANNVWGRAVSMSSTDTIKFLGMFDDTNSCAAACQKFNSINTGIQCRSFTYHTIQLNSTWSKQCFAVTDDTWGPQPENYINSGRIIQMNVYVTSDLKGKGITDIPGLQRENGGKRIIRARYPNADTELAQFPEGWILQAQSWIKPKNYSAAVTVLVDTPQRTDTIEFQYYTVGTGGSCSIFTPPSSYWCSANCSGGGAGLFETPQGLVYNSNTFFSLSGTGKWTNPQNTVVHVWHPYHWASWMYQLDKQDPATNTLYWSYGGFQGARGSITGHGNGGEWYVDNIFEELDAPNEYYYDTNSQLLYYFHNGTNPPGSDLKLVALNLKTLVEVKATQDQPARDITIQGVNFVAAAYTYLDPHGVPSGGDWAMARMGALFFEGTEGLTIDGCLLTRLDGNGITLSGYNRNATIQNNEISWIGENPMVAWGYTNGIDGTDGNQPRFTKVLGNLIHELGHYEKQSSPWFQALSCQNLIAGNIMFNGPRALINFNDGFGGGNEIVNNLLFNPNRETSDQGPFNSWDRLPYLTDVVDGKPSLTPLYNNIHHNFMICNYGSNMCIDNDDGSSYYLNHHNFEVYGGHKSDFGGHNKFTFDTLMAYAQDYQTGLCGDFNWVKAGYTDGYYNNICVQGVVVPYIAIDPCTPENSNPTVMPFLQNNKVFNQNATLTVQCGNTVITEAEFQAMGYDGGTTVDTLPSDNEILKWAKDLLKM